MNTTNTKEKPSHSKRRFTGIAATGISLPAAPFPWLRLGDFVFRLAVSAPGGIFASFTGLVPVFVISMLAAVIHLFAVQRLRVKS